MTRRAFTIPEILTVTFLGLIVMTMAAQLMWPAAEMYRREQASSDCYQSAQMVITRLGRELLNASFESVTLLDDPDSPIPSAVSFVPLQGFGPRGTPLYGSAVVCYYFLPAESRVIRTTWTPGRPPLAGSDYSLTRPEPPCLSHADLASICAYDAAQPLGGRVVGFHVRSFRVHDADDDPDSTADDNLAQLTPPLVLEVTTEALVHRRSRQPHTTSVVLQDSLTPRSTRW